MNESETVIKKERTRTRKNILIVVLILIILLLVGYIVYTDFIKINDTENEGVVDQEEIQDKSNKEVSQEIKNELLSIADINLDGEIDLHEGHLQSVFLANSGNINDFSSYTKRIIIYAYALKYKMVESFGEDYYDELPMCRAGSGICLAIKTNDYNSIAKKYGISDNGDKLYSMDSSRSEYTTKYNDYYVFDFGGWARDGKLKHDQVTFKHDGDRIIVTDNVSIIYEDGTKANKVVTYIFDKNNDGSYYLYSVSNRAM